MSDSNTIYNLLVKASLSLIEEKKKEGGRKEPNTHVENQRRGFAQHEIELASLFGFNCIFLRLYFYNRDQLSSGRTKAYLALP